MNYQDIMADAISECMKYEHRLIKCKIAIGILGAAVLILIGILIGGIYG